MKEEKKRELRTAHNNENRLDTELFPCRTILSMRFNREQSSVVDVVVNRKSLNVRKDSKGKSCTEAIKLIATGDLQIGMSHFSSEENKN